MYSVSGAHTVCSVIQTVHTVVYCSVHLAYMAVTFPFFVESQIGDWGVTFLMLGHLSMYVHVSTCYVLLVGV